MKQFSFIILLTGMLVAACTQQQKGTISIGQTTAANDDNTLYGLVCEGSNDTIVIFLSEPYDGSNPDTLDILEASRARQVFGSLRIGDRIAIIRDSFDTKKAARIIVTQDLLGQWCYKVKPTLRRRAGGYTALSEGSVDVEADSLHKLLAEEREYGFVLKFDSVVLPAGTRPNAASDSEDSPIVYPKAKRYRQWYIHNGQLLLTESTLDSLGNNIPLATDTAELVMLSADSLVLRFPDKEQSFYRKTETTP